MEGSPSAPYGRLRFDAHAAGSQAGSAYVFARSGGVWSEAKKLTASDATPEDWFGASTSLSGDTAVIGASMDSHPGIGAGSAYAFRLLDCAVLPSLAPNSPRYGRCGRDGGAMSSGVGVPIDCAVVGVGTRHNKMRGSTPAYARGCAE